MKKKKKAPQNAIVLTKDNISSLIVIAAALLNVFALLFALVDATREFRTETEKHFANGFSLIFGECPMAIESYANLFKFACVLHLIVAAFVIVLVGVRLLVKRKLSLGKTGVAALVLSAIFTTVYFILGFIAYAEATAYGGAGYGYSVGTFAFIPFALMVIAVASYILVRVKLPDGYRFVIKKKHRKDK